jgi:hypothetical protein
MIYRRTYVGNLSEILFRKRAEFSIDLKKSTKSQPQPFRADVFLLWKTLSTTPRPLYRWKAETVSVRYVSLVLGVNMSSLLSKSCQNYGIMFNG